LISLPDTRPARALVVIAIALVCSAHIGTLAVFFAGEAGPYDVQVSVRPPGVIPGLAQISIRVAGDGVSRVTAQAAQWNLGTRGAPAPDEAEPVTGAPGLYTTQLWLMTSASYAINVAVEGTRGTGRTVIPVNAVATKRLPMVPGLGWTLAGLGVFLTIGMLTIVRTATAESTLAPGEEPDAQRKRRGRGAAAAAAVVLGALIVGGWSWWNGVDGAYSRRIFRPMQASASVRTDSVGRVMRLMIDDRRWMRHEMSPLVPDHGKLVHLFLVRAPSMDALAHLHPGAVDSAAFETSLGTLPAGRYRFYADVVHESGFSQTLAGEVTVPPETAKSALRDPDDAVSVTEASQGDSARLSDSAIVIWHRPPALTAGTDEVLRFSVVAPNGSSVELEPYLGMPAHALVARDDASVFAHLHAGGSFAMVSQQVLEAIQRGDTLPSVRPGSSPRAVLPTSTEMTMHAPRQWSGDSLSIPFAFPNAGRYRVWLQVRHNGAIQTAAFDATVTEKSPK
jgi:hypothetical protein